MKQKSKIINLYLNKKFLIHETESSYFVQSPFAEHQNLKFKIVFWVSKNFMCQTKFKNQFGFGIIPNQKYDIFIYDFEKKMKIIESRIGSEILTEYEKIKKFQVEKFWIKEKEESENKNTVNLFPEDKESVEKDEDPNLSEAEIQKILHEFDNH